MIKTIKINAGVILARRVGIVLLCFLSTSINSQNYDYNWAFSTFWNDTISILSYTNNMVSIEKEIYPLSSYISFSNASMSNADGDFIFATNSCLITQSDFNIMENGDGINPGIPHNEQCRSGYKAGHQTCLTLPSPGSDSLYYLFHESLIYIVDSFFTILGDALRYSLIDISANSGNGIVLKKNVELVSDTSSYFACLTAVKHADNQSWWLIEPTRSQPCYNTWFVSSTGIDGPNLQCIGNLAIEPGQSGGACQFTPDGRKYIRWNPRDGIYIFDFDRQFGQLSNYEFIDHVVDSILFGGMAISPNSRFLYTTTLLDIYQYDLEADDILASRVHIDTYDGHASPGGCTFLSGQLGPDCKIYFNSTPGCTELHVVHKPDLKGKACDFRQHDLSFGVNMVGSLPHFPNYRLGTAPVCDPLLTATVIKIPILKPEYISIYPNPNDGAFTIDSPIPYDEVVIRDIQGLIVHRTQGDTVDMMGQNSGLYLVQLIRDGRMVGSGRFIVR